MRVRNLTAFLTPILLLLGLAWPATPAFAAPQPKVEICHIPPGNPDNFHTITISENAVSAHLAHGDLGGACDAACAVLCDDGDGCTIDDNGDCEQNGCPATPRESVDCNDSNECTDDSCEFGACVNAPRTGETCDDGVICTGPDTCDATGACNGSAIENCCLDDSACSQNPCDEASCNLGTNQCVEAPVECIAPDACTFSECASDTGECVDSPTVCPEGQSCDPDSGICSDDVACVPAPAGLVGWWPGDGNADDIAGINPGTLQGGAGYVPGKVGDAFSVGAASSDFVRAVRADASLEPARVTLDAWVRRAGSPGSSKYIAAKGASGCTASSYALYSSGGGLAFYVFNGSTFRLSPNAGPGVWDGDWHHVAGTYDGATVRLYVDSVEIGVGTATTINIGYSLPTTNDFSIGQYLGTCTSLFFGGDVDEVEVFSRALSQTEIQSIYDAGSDGKCKD